MAGQTDADVIEIDELRGRQPRVDEDTDPVFSLDGEEVEGGDDEFFYDEDAPNLVTAFLDHPEGREALQELSAKMVRDFDNAFEATSEYRERKARDWKIFSGDLPEKTFPFENSANPHVPIMLENISRLSFRAIGEIFGDWTNVFGVVPVGPEDEVIADVLSKHGNWQIREKIPDFSRQQHRGVLLYFLQGDVTCHSFYSVSRKENRHEMLTCDEFVVPYTYVSTMPDYSDVPYRCRIHHYYAHELEDQEGLWEGVEQVIEGQKPSYDSEPEEKLREAEAEVEGIFTPDSDENAPYKVLQYEGWMTLPNQDRQRFVQGFVDYASGNLMQLSIHEELDWEDKERFDRQTRELEEYREATQAWEQAATTVAAAEKRILENPELDTAARQQFQMNTASQPLPPRPPPPMWTEEITENTQPEPPRKVPIHMFSHGVNIEPLTGNLGFGFGRIEADFNRAANTALSQFSDAATLNNCKGWITSNLVEFKRPFSLKPGAINIASGVTGGELKNNIMPMDPGPASPQLMELVNMMYQWGQSAVQAPAVLSGEPGKSGETFRGIATRLEQATKQLSVSSRKYANEFLAQILKNNARLNSIYLPDEELFMVNQSKVDPVTGMIIGPRPERVTRTMYRRNYDVEFRADMRYASEAQKVAEADELVMQAQQIPILAENLAFQYAVVKKALEARGRDDLILKMGPEPPPPMAPVVPTPEEEELPPEEAPGPSGPAGAAPEGPPQ